MALRLLCHSTSMLDMDKVSMCIKSSSADVASHDWAAQANTSTEAKISHFWRGANHVNAPPVAVAH